MVAVDTNAVHISLSEEINEERYERVHTTLLEQEQSSMLYDTYVLALPTGHKAKSNNGSPSEKWHLACQLEGGQGSTPTQHKLKLGNN